MSTAKKKPAHRPPLPEHLLRSAVIRMRATQEEFEKFLRLGGGDWLRGVLKRAREKE